MLKTKPSRFTHSSSYYFLTTILKYFESFSKRSFMTASLEYGPTLRNFNRLFALLEVLDVEAFLDPLKKDLFFRWSILKDVA